MAQTLCLLSVVLVPLAGAQSNLLQRSPFLPPGYDPNPPQPEPPPRSPTPPTPPPRLEYNGFVKIGDNYEFAIIDPDTRRHYFLALNERRGDLDFTIVDYDPNTHTIQVDFGHTTQQLQLKQANNQSLPIVGARPVNNAPARTNVGPSNNTNNNNNQPTRRRIIRRTVLPSR